MVTECIRCQSGESKLIRFLRANQLSTSEFHLMMFWAKNPYAKLSLYTITDAINTAGANMRDAITALVKKNILIERHNSEELTTYCLNNNYELREYINELNCMNKDEIKFMQKQLEGAAI
jgi:DNA-binding MarR family transcriptional regulator